jgi:hypothetical protein
LWHPTKNGELTPADVLPRTEQIFWWQCEKGHEWQTSPRLQIHNTHGCPKCPWRSGSLQEQQLRSLLAILLPVAAEDGNRIVADDKVWWCDIVVPTMQLIIEFDGRWYHRDRHAQDKVKSDHLRSNGWRVIRVRERPLRKTHPDDILIDFGDLEGAADQIHAKLGAPCAIAFVGLLGAESEHRESTYIS